MKLQIMCFMMLALATAATAQLGPHPGYESGAEYAAAYGQERAASAAADPVSFASEYDESEELGAHAAHAAYMACWVADDAGAQDPSSTCSQYYTPPSDVNPKPSAEEEAASTANQTIDDVNATAQEVVDVVQEEVVDLLPLDSPANEWIDSVQEASAELLAFLKGALDMGADGLIKWAVESSDLLQDTLKLIGLGFDTSAAGYGAAWDGTVAGAEALKAASIASGDALGDAAGATGDAVADASKAVGEAIAEAASAVADAVSGLFAQGAPVLQQEAQKPIADGVDDTASDLLGDVVDLSMN